MSRVLVIFLTMMLVASCGKPSYISRDVHPAEEFSRAYKNGNVADYSFHNAAKARTKREAAPAPKPAPQIIQLSHGLAPTSYGDTPAQNPQARAQFRGDQRFLQDGFQLKKSVAEAPVYYVNEGGAAQNGVHARNGQLPIPPTAAMPPAPPPGSSAPYAMGQMRANPSLWPDEAQGAFLFNDYRASQPMDIVTIVINENNKGTKKADTETKSEFDLIAGITEFFGVETSKWAANNTSLDPSQLISASTDTEYKGEGETEREGKLSGRVSAVIMEKLPNGLLRIEGTKIISLNEEEEILVISGLVRQRDISSLNEVDSNRVANVRIDFYGRGVVGDQQKPGWGSKIFELVWPF